MGEMPPYDPEAEVALVGALLLDRAVIEDVVGLCSPEDLYQPKYRAVYRVIMEMYERGEAVDSVTLTGALREAGDLDRVGGPSAVIELLASAGFASNVKGYAQRIVRCAGLRKLISLTEDVRQRAMGQEDDPAALIDELIAASQEITTSDVVEVPSDLWVMDEFLDRPVTDRPPWVIPGLLRIGWRTMVVAQEGVGKTVLFRQLGLAAAQGIHPLRYTSMDPCRTLIVDLENPDDSIMDVCNPIRRQAKSVTTDYDPDRAWLWHRPGGVNLRSRRDRSEFEAVLMHVRPTLVCLGPIYKSYRVEARESDEIAASEVMAVFDDLRTRYGFALMLEHHAPKGSGGHRELMPYGSSLWLRWPEIGLKLEAVGEEGNDLMAVGRWRGDRLENEWPDMLERSRPWPWRGVWEGQEPVADYPRHWQEEAF